MNQQPSSPASEGVVWVQIALRYFNAEKLRWIALSAGFLFALQLATILGYGRTGALALVVKPILNVGFLSAAWHQERKQTPEISHLLAGFKSNLPVLLLMGVVYALGAEAAAWLATQFTGIPSGIDIIQLDETKAVRFLSHMTWTMAFMLPVVAAVWFAPALVVFEDLGLVAALKVSLLTSVKHLGAIFLCVLSLFSFSAFIIGVIIFLSALWKPLFSLSMFAFLVITAINALIDYISYRRIFHPEQPLS
jgi:hypothetical protein